MDIKTSDIYCLSVAMNVGDISENAPGEKRAELLMNHLGYLLHTKKSTKIIRDITVQ